MTDSRSTNLKRAMVFALATMPLIGCSVVATPCRVGSAALKAVPVVGGAAAAPTDACADVIDPTPTKS